MGYSFVGFEIVQVTKHATDVSQEIKDQGKIFRHLFQSRRFAILDAFRMTRNYFHIFVTLR